MFHGFLKLHTLILTVILPRFHIVSHLLSYPVCYQDTKSWNGRAQSLHCAQRQARSQMGQHEQECLKLEKHLETAKHHFRCREILKSLAQAKVYFSIIWNHMKSVNLKIISHLHNYCMLQDYKQHSSIFHGFPVFHVQSLSSNMERHLTFPYFSYLKEHRHPFRLVKLLKGPFAQGFAMKWSFPRSTSGLLVRGIPAMPSRRRMMRMQVETCFERTPQGPVH